MTSVKKNGIVSASGIYETRGTNLVANPDNEYTYTPTTANNNSITGYTVNFESCKPGQMMHAECDIEYSGFDSSNTDGTFRVKLQGSVYVVETDAYAWAGDTGVCNMKNGSANITSIVLSAESGKHHFSYDWALPSTVPETYSKQHFGIRSDYSNGKGTITLKNLYVTPLAYHGDHAKFGIGSDNTPPRLDHRGEPHGIVTRNGGAHE